MSVIWRRWTIDRAAAVRRTLLVLAWSGGLAAAGAQEVTKEGFVPMDPRAWFGHLQRYGFEAGQLAEAGVEPHFQLGRWAWDHGLEDEAWEQWILAVQRDPDHAGARAAMGFARRGGDWERPGQVNPDWVKRVEAQGQALVIDVAIADDAPPEFFEEFRWRLRRLNWFLWDVTEGQTYLKAVTVEDRKTNGRFVVPANLLQTPVLQGGGAYCLRSGTADWQVVSGGRCYVRILAHEMMHGLFALPDERQGCRSLMQGGLYGVKTSQLTLCDDSTHHVVAEVPESMWTLIKRRHPEMAHPNPAAHGAAPEPVITVVNH